jgi:hypothetical protein
VVDAWLSYAESNCGTNATKALSDCTQGGVSVCSPIQYLDANWIYAQGSLPVAASAQESWWLHLRGYSDSQHRIAASSYGGGNILNQSNPSVDSWFTNYVHAHFDSYAGLMMDDSSSSLSAQLYYSGQTTSNETTTDSALQAAHNQMAASITHDDGGSFLQIDNALTPNDYLAPPFAMLNQSTGVQGLVAEGAPMSNGTLTSYFSTLLDEMAYVDQTANDFVVLLSYDPSGSPRARRVQTATTLLGYSPGHTVSWADLETNSSNLAVWPEEGIVPTNPIQSMSTPSGSGCLAGQGVVCPSGGHHSLQVAPGIYRREFSDCYNQGAAFGPCAVVINTTNSSATVDSSWLSQSYGHEITFNGGDVQSGGSIDTTGATFVAGSATVPADDAVLLSR